jgi:hypothetical protein
MQPVDGDHDPVFEKQKQFSRVKLVWSLLFGVRADVNWRGGGRMKAGLENSARQTCKVCGRADKFDFHVPDIVWKRVVPQRYHNKVVCLPCFDNFALKKQINYSDSLEVLYFAGDRAVFKFQTVSAQNV